MALLAVRAEVAVLAIHIRAGKGALLKAILSSLLLRSGWKIARSEELVDKSLVLADTVGEHATVVTVVVNAPLYIDSVASLIGHNRSVTPVGSRLVVVDADTGVVATRTTPADLGLRNVGPCGHGLQNGTLGASVQAGLETQISTIDLPTIVRATAYLRAKSGTTSRNGQISMGIDRCGRGKDSRDDGELHIIELKTKTGSLEGGWPRKCVGVSESRCILGGLANSLSTF